MYGAIIGDIVGSIYEFDNIKTKDFPLFQDRCFFTDDTVMTVAVARALLKARESKSDFKKILISEMQDFGRRYPGRGYGCRFVQWLQVQEPQPYNSYGNGSAMRASPCGLMAVTLSEALSLAKASAEVTHNHPEGIKGAQAVAGAVFLAKCHKPKEEIRDFIQVMFYDLDKSLDEIRPTYRFNKTCQETVPQAIQAFLESESFEDAIRNAISIGGDSDTVAAITGSIAWTYYTDAWDIYAEPEKCKNPNLGLLKKTAQWLPEEFRHIIQEFSETWISRIGTYGRVGSCSRIPHTGKKAPTKKLVTAPVCLDGTPLKERLYKAERFCSSEPYSKIMTEQKLCVRNYTDYIVLINHIAENQEYLSTASLEVCLVYLSYLWSAEIFSGGYPEFYLRHCEEIRAARRRIVDLLFEE